MSSSLRELYPSGAASLETHQELLHRHARRIETGDMRGTALHERIVDVRADLDKFAETVADKLDKNDREMSEQTQALVDIKLDLARKDGETKRLGVWVALATPLISAGLMLLANYLTRAPTGPGPVHLTTEQMQQIQQLEAAPKR